MPGIPEGGVNQEVSGRMGEKKESSSTLPEPRKNLMKISG